MKQYLILKIKECKGVNEALAFIGCVVALFAVFFICVMGFTPFMVKADTVAFNKALVRQIEIHGAIDGEINDFAERLANVYNLSPEITYEANNIPGTNHIQIRDDFTVKVKTTADIVLFDSSLFQPVVYTININDTKVGISEKLWKD